MDNLNYCTHIFDESTDGYIQLIKLSDRKAIKIYNTEYKSLRTIVEEVIGEEDIYISSNTYYKPKRSTSYIRQFRALYIDLDLKEHPKSGTVYAIYDLVQDNKIPMPSMIVDSGRGLHLYWRIENAPYGAIQTWQELEDYLYNQLKDLGADIKATDGARVLRLPNTINSRNKAKCKVVIINGDIRYSMYDLREQYLNYKPKRGYQLQFEQTKEVKKQGTVSRLFNSYTLHLARANDIKKLCELRNYKVKGYRNFILHCYAYWEGIYTRDPEELANKVIELNNAFKPPIKANEVKAILRCVPKAIAKFIEYEQGIRSGKVKRVSKGMKDKGGYWYKNSTLIEALDITPEEQVAMETIIGMEEKYRRNNERRTPRNEAGLTPREQAKQELIQKVKKLKAEGLKQKDIAERLSITKGTVSKYLKL